MIQPRRSRRASSTSTCTGKSCAAGFVLVRTGGPGSDQWLLMHKHDEYAVTGWDPEDFPASVLSGRTNDQVKADPARMWRSDLPPAEASVALRRPPDDPPAPRAGISRTAR